MHSTFKLSRKFKRQGLAATYASPKSSRHLFVQDRKTNVNILVDTRSDCCLISATRSDKLSVPIQNFFVANGHMSRSNSNYASLLHLVPKKGSNDWCPIGDYKALTIKPNETGFFESTQMQFGLCNASSTFQRFIDGVTRGLDGAYAFVDDILIASQSYEVYIENLQGLFFTSDHYRLTINLSKCTFGVHTLDSTGFTVSKAGFSPICNRVDAIQKYPRYTTLTKLHEKAFTDAKKVLAEATLLRHPILDAPLSYWREAIISPLM
ncbi:transposon Ty3-G Gag-Pol polyprotein [Nephila pilipes]|uniref:Transposon Ty3-G Gag-Pol polyprotein n=1 Tax=Nephila pilipes TaxID=299642 RepID=A0A8X6TVV9_NEPPI|nr:transposon Ty3-G Gag-Pol polyprotein [Nephila pilipes]